MRKILAFFVILFTVLVCGFAQAALLPIGSGSLSEIISFSENSNKFPMIRGINLEGKSVIIPDELIGKKKLLIVAFKRKQQEDVNTWLLATKALLEKHHDFAVYEIPTIKEMNFLMRFNINNGMRYGIHSKVQRANTITLYLDKEKYKDMLDIETEDLIYAYLVNESGQIVWRNSGLASDTKIKDLERQLN